MSTEFFNDQWRIPSNENQNKISNYSMDFDGSSDYIDLGDNFSFGNGTTDSPFSISAWINMDSTSGFRIIGRWDSSVADYEYTFGTGGANKLQLFMYDGTNQASGYRGIVMNTILNTGQWYHTVVTYDGRGGNNAEDGVKIYVDGALVSVTNTVVGTYTAMNDLSLNAYIGKLSPSSYANGKIDQLTVFDYALSQDQVTQLGAEGYAFNFIPNDYIDLGTTTAYDTGDLSAATWVNASSSRTGTVYPFSNSGSPSFAGFDFVIYTNNEIRIRRSTRTKSNQTNQINIGFVSDTWQHLALTYSESTNTLKVFLNGVLKATNVGTNQTNTASKKLTIGSYRGTSAFFDGELSNAQVFNSKLEDSEIATLYNNGKPLTNMSGFTSLQGWWKLDDTEVFNTTSTEWSIDNNQNPSTYKSSLDFDGNNDYIDISSAAATTFNNLSFSGWLNWDGSQYSSVFSFSPLNGQDTATGFAIEVRTGGEVRVGYAGQSWGVIVSSAITANTWTHIAVTLSASGVILYKNGVSIGTGATPGTPIYKTAFIGARAYGSTPPPLAGQYFGGTLSNIALWNTALTAPQIVTLYNNGTPEAAISHSPIAWYKLNNLTTGIQDSVGSNNGTNNGAIEYPGFVNNTAAESVGMDVSNLVASNINGELIANPMATSPKPIAYYQLGDQSVSTGPTSDYLVPNNSLSDYVFDFDSAGSNYIDLGTPFSFTENLSVSLWVKSTQTVTNTFIGKDTSSLSGGRNWMVMQYQNKVYFWTTDTGVISSLFSIQSNASINDGNWHHIVCVNNYANSTKQIYIDGSLDITNNNGAVISNSSSLVWIGRRPSGFPYDGEMSNVAVWNSALTGPQITTLYNNGAPGDISSLSPVGWYKLNASEIFNSTSTEWSVDNNAYPSVYKSSLDFDSDSISCGNTLGSGYSLISVSSWVNFDNPNSNVREEIISKDDGSSNRTFFLVKFENSDWAAYGTIGFAINDGTTTSNATVSQADFTPSANTWYNILGTWDGTNIKLYINGVLKKTTAFSASNLDTNTVNVLIGDSSASGTYFLNGQISNTAIWNTALTAPQVTTIYNNGQPQAAISHSPVSWWKLDNTTTGIQDSAGSNNGTNNGATEYAGFVNGLAGESSGMDSSNLVVSDLQQTSGYSPYALTLDPNDSNQLILNNGGNAILNGATSLTVSAWINPTADTGTFQNIFTNWAGNIMIRFNNTEALQVYLNSVSPSFIGTANGTITFGEWQHIVVTYSGSEVKIYRNNILKSSAAATGTLGTSASTDIIGNRPSTTQFFNGKMSNVAVWKNSVIDVNTLYNQGLPSDLTSLSPTGWWQLGSNSSFNSGIWTSLNQGIGSTSLVPANATSSGAMTNDDITNGPGYSAMGLGTSSIDIKGDAPYSTANGLSENMDVLDRTTDIPS